MSIFDRNVRQAAEYLLEYCHEDLKREGLKETPERFAEAWEFYTQGYVENPDDILKVFEDGASNYDEMVFQGNIPMYSLCEHHLAPFFGVVHIGYIPNKSIVGLSKLARLAEIYTRRLQVQERITTQICEALEEHLNPIGVGVVLQCRHLCMEARGVQKHGTVTTTSSLKGVFRDKPEARAEFMAFVRASGENQII
jgi:GTP cyclohydrolase I